MSEKTYEEKVFHSMCDLAREIALLKKDFKNRKSEIRPYEQGWLGGLEHALDKLSALK